MSKRDDLSVLLSRGLLIVTRCYEDAGAGRNGMPSLALYSGVLAHLGRDGIDVNALAQRTRLSRRAVISGVTVARRHGWAEADTTGRPGPLSVVVLTDAGADVGASWPDVERRALRAWNGLAGKTAATSLRNALVSLVGRLPLEHPHYPFSYGPADTSVTGGPGVDWKAVPRQRDGGAGRLGVAALLSQALVAFTLDYERRVRFPLNPTANVLHRFTGGRLDVETAQQLGVAGNGRSGLERHGIVRVSGGPDRVASLTSVGKRLRAAYQPAVTAIDADWETHFGSRVIGDIRRTLTEIVPGDVPLPRHLLVRILNG